MNKITVATTLMYFFLFSCSNKNHTTTFNGVNSIQRVDTLFVNDSILQIVEYDTSHSFINSVRLLHRNSLEEVLLEQDINFHDNGILKSFFLQLNVTKIIWDDYVEHSYKENHLELDSFGLTQKMLLHTDSLFLKYNW